MMTQTKRVKINNSKGRPSSARGPGTSEYSNAYPSTSANPRPRTTIPTWSTRNRSNIIPSEPESVRPAAGERSHRPARRQQPWQAQIVHSEVIPRPDAPTDANNNPVASVPLGQNPQRWPWQRRAQESSPLFLFDRQAPTTTTAPVRRTRFRYPWQERAWQSQVFELPEVKVLKFKTYQWDQRKSTPFLIGDEDTKLKEGLMLKRVQKFWPWQKQAQESNIFKPAEKEGHKGFKYPWDQRQSAFDVKDDDTKVKFEGVSRYQQDFTKAKGALLKNIEPAGKPCYGVEKAHNDGSKKNFEKTLMQTSEDIENSGVETKKLSNEFSKNIIPLFDKTNYRSASSKTNEDSNNSSSTSPSKTKSGNNSFTTTIGSSHSPASTSTVTTALVPFGKALSNNNNSNNNV